MKSSHYLNPYEELMQLCQLMFDPENRPPQIGIDAAWEELKRITGLEPSKKPAEPVAEPEDD